MKALVAAKLRVKYRWCMCKEQVGITVWWASDHRNYCTCLNWLRLTLFNATVMCGQVESEKINTNIARDGEWIPWSSGFLEWRGEDYWLKGEELFCFFSHCFE